MNFFGHAVVASWVRREDGFVLGSMLPDFATMIRARPPAAVAADVSEGIAFHHDTDRVFHATEAFCSLEREARGHLADTDLRRGSRLAVAHIGVELILDGVLARQRTGVRAFTSALSAGSGPLAEALLWDEPGAAKRYDQLLDAMRARLERGRPENDAATLAWRIDRALSGRPRLQLAARDKPSVERWVQHMTPRVEARADALIAEICRGLRVEEPERATSR